MPAAAVALAASAPVAQWIRADGFYPLGRRFESCRGRFERDELRIAASSRGGSCFGTAPPRDSLHCLLLAPETRGRPTLEGGLSPRHHRHPDRVHVQRDRDRRW